jgi:hypothetical protein
MEGFENYNKDSDVAGVWNKGAQTPVYQAATRGSPGAAIELGSSRTLNHAITENPATCTVGFAFKHDNAMTSAFAFLQFREAAAAGGFHIEIRVNTSGQIEARRFVTIVDTSNKSLSQGVWYYIEAKLFVSDGAGTCEVWVNGKKGGWIDFSGDTQNGGNAFVDAIQLQGLSAGAGGPFTFDDLYVLDDSGGAPGNDRLGDSIVETLNPSGAGLEAQWSPSAGSNFQNVDEPTPDDDTTFNSSQVVDDDDRFAMDNLVNVPSTVFGVQVNGMFRLENSGARDIRLKVHDGVTEGQSVDKTPSFDPNYSYEFEVFEDHPTGAAPWSTAEVNAMEAGYRIQA